MLLEYGEAQRLRNKRELAEANAPRRHDLKGTNEIEWSHQT